MSSNNGFPQYWNENLLTKVGMNFSKRKGCRDCTDRGQRYWSSDWTTTLLDKVDPAKSNVSANWFPSTRHSAKVLWSKDALKRISNGRMRYKWFRGNFFWEQLNGSKMANLILICRNSKIVSNCSALLDTYEVSNQASHGLKFNASNLIDSMLYMSCIQEQILSLWPRILMRSASLSCLFQMVYCISSIWSWHSNLKFSN